MLQHQFWLPKSFLEEQRVKDAIASKRSALSRRWAQVVFGDGSRFSSPPAAHGQGRLSSIQPCLAELFGAGIVLDICTTGISCASQLLDTCSQVLFAVQILPRDEIFCLEDFTHGATEIEAGSAAVVYVPVMLKMQLLGLWNEVSRWWQ